MSKPENPPAFPFSSTREIAPGVPVDVQNPGMSLRDWFAGQALPLTYQDSAPGAEFAQIAEDAYALADAMLSEREKSLSHSEGEEK